IHVIRHLSVYFAVMRVPKEIKPDNGPAYRSQKVGRFMQRWGVKHTTGIPHESTGQAIIARAHHT
ncbi:POK19 protein, partial [Catharus fuscescens]|nr:POK19 protein [Catharus fuscescens]